MNLHRLTGLLALCAAAALPARVSAEAMVARYDVQAAGFTIMQVEALVDLNGPDYLVRTRVIPRGVMTWFTGGEQVSSAEGRWRGMDPMPLRYRTDGVWRGNRRMVAMDYTPSGRPQLRAIEPANTGEHEPVPDALQHGTMDTLSALAKLSRTVARTGRCDLAAGIFDGRRRADLTVRTISQDLLAREGGFAGQALRCELESRVIAGFHADQDRAQAAEPQPATAWLGRPLPGGGPLPVRVEIPTRWFGDVRIVLTGVEPAGASGRAAAEQPR